MRVAIGSFLRFIYFLSEQPCALLQDFQLRFHKCEMKETEGPLSHYLHFLCRIIYSDTSANEDNSFRGHIR